MAATLREHLEFYRYGPAQRELLAELRPLLSKHAEELVDEFYRHLRSDPEGAAVLADAETAKRLRGFQREYLLSLAGPEIDEDYVRERSRIGEIHERLGLSTSLYLGAYAHYLGLLTPLVLEHFAGEPERQAAALSALQRLLLFDADIAMGRYIERRESELERANRQLERNSQRLSAELESTDAELRQTTQRALAAERLADVGVLVAGLAHEIGTPMGVIQGHAKLLEPAVEGERARWRLQTIREQIGRIGRIIQALLNMARPGRTQPLVVELAPLLESTVAFVREKLQRQGIEVVWELEDAPPVLGDPERLQQVVLNLLLNAADVMPDGGKLFVGLAPNQADGIEIRVGDTGPGVPEAARRRVFDPFFTTKRAGEGNGLGLSVAHGIVQEHGGRLSVGSHPSGGAEFRVVLPRLAEAKSAEAKSSARPGD